MNSYFVGRKRPLIDSTADFLFSNRIGGQRGLAGHTDGTGQREQTSNAPRGASLDLSNWLVVVPSLRTQRNLTSVLIQNAAEQSLILELPTIITVGRLPEKLYRQNRPLADPITQQLAWMSAIRQADLPARNEFFPLLPQENDLSASLMMGKQMVQLHTELSAEGLSFSAVVEKLRKWSAQSGENQLGENETAAVSFDLEFERRRWEYLIEVQNWYHRILDGLNLWDKNSARLFALEHPKQAENGLAADFQINYQILLVGLVDLNRVQKQMLNRVRDQVVSLVFAPEAEADGFDEWGVLKTRYWSQGLNSPVKPEQIVQAEKPMDQALCAFDFIQSLCGKYSLDEITIGVPDPKITHFVERAAHRFQVKVDNSVGQPLNQTGPFLLLQTIVDFLDRDDFSSLAALVRHPAVYEALVASSETDVAQFKAENFSNTESHAFTEGNMYKGIDNRKDIDTESKPAALANSESMRQIQAANTGGATNTANESASSDSSSSRYIRYNSDPLAAMDRFRADRFPLSVAQSLNRTLVDSYICKAKDLATVRRVIRWTYGWLSDWRKDRIEIRDLGASLGKLFGELGLNNSAFASSLDRQAKAQIIAAGRRLESVPKALTEGAIAPQSALEMIIGSVEQINLPVTEEEFDNNPDKEPETPEKNENRDGGETSENGQAADEENYSTEDSVLDVTGWLEMVWDRRPAAVILSFNDGIVPQSSSGHLFLPNQLRRYLGIVDNDRRLARDAYYLRSIVDSRQDLRIVFGLRGTEEGNLLPSRLLFNQQNPDLARQVLNWFDEKGQKARYEFAPGPVQSVPALRESRSAYEWARQNLSGETPVLAGLITQLSATKFRDYITCPFRFYLKHVLKLQSQTDSGRELDAAGFGTLMHEVLDFWGRDEIERARRGEPQQDEETITQQLNKILDQAFQAFFPDQVLPTVLLQKEVVRERCAAFAKLQANWEYGRIIATEKSYFADLPLENGAVMKLEGKIDRIDQSDDGAITLIDYKSYDQEKTPEKTHRPKPDGPWTDLQLPIYRYVVQKNAQLFGLSGDAKPFIQTGLLLLPKNQRAKLDIAGWSEGEYEDADREALRIAQQIYNGVFWPPNEEEVPFDDFKDYVDWILNGAQQ